MTMINPYGIGAGKAIAEQYEDGPEKVRKESKRLEAAAQIADRERLKAHLQQRPAEHFRASQLRSPGDAAAGMSRALRKSLNEESDRLNERLLNEEQRLEAVADANSALGKNAVSIDPKPERLDQRLLESLADGTDPGLPGGLLSRIRGISGRLTRERALSNLEDLNESIRARHAEGRSLEDSEGVLGYLDFLDGYFESGAKNPAQSEKMVALMAEIRIQLSLVTDPGTVSLHQQLALRAETGELAAGVKPDLRTTSVEHRQAARERKAQGVLDGDDDSDRLDATQPVPPASVASAAAVGSAGAQDPHSSQGKNPGRRQEETLVSVTLRSI